MFELLLKDGDEDVYPRALAPCVVELGCATRAQPLRGQNASFALPQAHGAEEVEIVFRSLALLGGHGLVAEGPTVDAFPDAVGGASPC